MIVKSGAEVGKKYNSVSSQFKERKFCNKDSHLTDGELEALLGPYDLFGKKNPTEYTLQENISPNLTESIMNIHSNTQTPDSVMDDIVGGFEKNKEIFLTTGEVAKLLYMSVAKVQYLVDRKILKAWKTEGGHRKISSTSVANYKKEKIGLLENNSEIKGKFKILIFVKNIKLDEKKELAVRFQKNVELIFVTSFEELYMEMIFLKPKILILEVDGNEQSQLNAVNQLNKYSSKYQFGPFSTILMSACYSINEFGLEKNLNHTVISILEGFTSKWFNGFLLGLLQNTYMH